MEKTLIYNINNLFRSINKIRNEVDLISSNINLKEEVFDEMYKLLIQLEDGTRIIDNKYRDNENKISQIEVSGYSDCSKVESYMWSPKWKKVL